MSFRFIRILREQRWRMRCSKKHILRALAQISMLSLIRFSEARIWRESRELPDPTSTWQIKEECYVVPTMSTTLNRHGTEFKFIYVFSFFIQICIVFYTNSYEFIDTNSQNKNLCIDLYVIRRRGGEAIHLALSALPSPCVIC